jgi:hypothetical protein
MCHSGNEFSGLRLGSEYKKRRVLGEVWDAGRLYRLRLLKGTARRAAGRYPSLSVSIKLQPRAFLG